MEGNLQDAKCNFLNYRGKVKLKKKTIRDNLFLTIILSNINVI